MTNPTTPFSWQMPTASDLVTDLPADFETFGQAVATSMADLLGGTTGQVLSKASNTDMDFTWVTSDDANAIQNAIVDAKGDLIAATAADTPARLAVGTNGQVLTADSTAATGLAWATPSGGSNTFYAGKNKVINGDFGIWQRGTSFTDPNGSYTVDRWRFLFNGSGSRVVSQQTFTPATAPVSGYEGQYFARVNQTTAGTGGTYQVFDNLIEDVRTYAGQAITLSFWAKAAATTSITVGLNQNFGSGGSSEVNSIGATTISLTTSWTRYTISTTMTSISGKTIGTGSNIFIRVALPNNETFTFDSWGWQLEAGSSATDFVTASGNSKQGELAMCQRYYWRTSNSAVNNANLGGNGFTYATTAGAYWVNNPVAMRTFPSAVDAANLRVYDITGGAAYTATATISTDSTTINGVINFAVTGATANRVVRLDANTTGGYLGFSAEL